jgi:hypothetical protein
VHRREANSSVSIAEGLLAGATSAYFALGNINRCTDPLGDFSLSIKQGDRTRMRPTQRAIGANDTVFQLEDALSLNGAIDGLPDYGLVVWMNVFF